MVEDNIPYDNEESGDIHVNQERDGLIRFTELRAFFTHCNPLQQLVFVTEPRTNDTAIFFIPHINHSRASRCRDCPERWKLDGRMVQNEGTGMSLPMPLMPDDDLLYGNIACMSSGRFLSSRTTSAIRKVYN